MDMLCILGPTACGKTRLAVETARRTNGEILSADSRQVYRGMDIGTGKDLAEYGEIPYHLVDLLPAGEKYNLFRYQQDFLVAYEDVCRRGKFPILCGGSGMYIEAVCRAYPLPDVPQQPEWRAAWASLPTEELIAKLETLTPLHNTTDTCSRRRLIRALEIATWQKEHPAEYADFPSIKTCIVGLDPGRDERRARITARLQARFKEGLVEEVRELLNAGVPARDLMYYGLEYKYITQYVIGQLSYDACYSGLETAIHQFAKRQMTWFRGMERRGLSIHWLRGPDYVDEILELVG